MTDLKPDDEPTPDVTDTVNPESVDKAPDIEAGPEDDPATSPTDPDTQGDE